MAAASSRPDPAFQWVCEVEAPSTTYESLADSGESELLDVKLCAAIFKLAKGDMNRRLTHLADMAARDNVRIKGRPCL